MRTKEEVQKKLEGINEDIENMQALLDAAIGTKQYGVAKDVKARLAVRKRDAWVLNWILEDTEQ